MRHTERDKRTGRYVDGPKCEACGKSSGYNYCSLSTVNQDGIGLVVCANCAAFHCNDTIGYKGAKTLDEAMVNGECRLNPPVVTTEHYGEFPGVRGSWWCQQFKRAAHRPVAKPDLEMP